jgi:outer membrane receptor for ferrienterochelin and colicins
MLSRVEVVKGGGSALYGSSAIGGVMNLIITPPLQNSWSIGQNVEMIGMKTPEYFSTANISNVSQDGNTSFNIFLSHRQREDLDINGDGFSELPSLNATTAGITGSWKLKGGKKISLNTGILNEYRRGGNKFDKPAYLTDQAEERSQNMVFSDLEYFQFTGKNRNELNMWLSGQYTTRNHYTGALPEREDSAAYYEHLEEPPYGHTVNYSISSGVQYHLRPSKIFNKKNEIILGAEYYFDHIRDAIPAFDYDLSQTIVNPAFYLQSIWDIGKRTVLQTGVRTDLHNYLSNPAFNPRLALLFKLNPNSSLRANVSTGFRAPMFFDTDLHMSMAAGEVRRVLLSPDLKTENSQTGCITYMSDFPGDKHVFGFTVEGFYTRLQNAFQLEIMTDPLSGNRFFMKENADNATVAGISVEFRARLWKKHMLMLSYTYQKSMYSDPVDWSEEIPGVRRFLRTPDEYGFLSYMTQLGNNWNTTISGVYTGSMLIPHYGLAGDEGTPENDILYTSPHFFDLNLRLQKTLELSKNNKLDLYIGVRNLLNSYQNDFDKGKNRDSDYIYGPARPRGLFFGVKLRG